LKLIFAGTPEFAARHLDALISSEHDILAVYTQPDRPAGRGKKLLASAVKQRAQEAGLEVRQPQSLKKTDEQQALAALQADLMIVVAYGLILPQAVLEAPRLGCINVHASILPRWRGAAPIQRAIEAGDQESGVTIMQMDIGLDTGDMLLIKTCPIDAQDNSAQLHDRLAELGPPALLESLDLLAAGDAQAIAQDHQLANYAHKIEKQEAEIDWSLSAELLLRKIKAFNPFPICFCNLDDKRFKIWDAEWSSQSGQAGRVIESTPDCLVVACGEHSLSLTCVQIPGKKAMPIGAFQNGYSELCPIGTLLT
jgi:methionyl-tRNA formyltransferase